MWPLLSVGVMLLQIDAVLRHEEVKRASTGVKVQFLTCQHDRAICRFLPGWCPSGTQRGVDQVSRVCVSWLC